MRSRVPFFALLLVTGSFALPLAAHAGSAGGIPFFGPIIDQSWVTGNTNIQCALGWGVLIEVINRIISLLLTLAIVFVAPIMIAYAGFLYVINPADTGNIGKARGILWNVVRGIVIALAGWMIVDALMAVLYNPSTPVAGGTLGTWSSLISGDGIACLSQAGVGTGLNQAPTTGVGAVGTLTAPPSGRAGTACDPATVQAAAATGGYTISNTQANIFACIAYPESSCRSNPSPPNYNWNSAHSSPGSTAAGAFQILLFSNHTCYENSTCYSAVGLPTNGSTELNCQNAFDSSGNPKTDPVGAALVQTCLTAADNLNCSASAAACLLAQNGGSFSPWQADYNSAVQTGCITSGG